MIESVDAKIDFLTVTTDNCVETGKLSALAAKIAAPLPKTRSWRMLRYVGWMAVDPSGQGGVAVGYISKNKGLMQVWGAMADRWLFEAMRGMHAKVTRVDYAVTLLFDHPQPPISEVIKTLNENDAVYTAIIPVSQAGGTLYVGSRASEKFGRIYDKGVQLGDVPPRLYWRYELEFKRSCARNAVNILTDASLTREKVSTIVGNVWTYFANAGIPMPSLAATAMGYPVVRYGVVARSFDKTLTWLQTQVNPALVRLFESGYGHSALLALGIEGTDCVTVQVNTDVCDPGALQDDFFELLQTGGNGHNPVMVDIAQ